VTVTASAVELIRGYEALRAEAVGKPPVTTPRGRAVLLRDGLVAWMRALPPSTPAARTGGPPTDAPAIVTAGLRRELVDVLAAMALGPGRSWHRAS
jgi:hypothetical protein